MKETNVKKTTIFKEYGGSESNTGSIEVNVALLTERIAHISNHLKLNKKDFSTQRGLMKLVGQRKSLLKYLHKHDIQKYRTILEKLGLRK